MLPLLIPGILGIIDKVLGAVIPDPAARAKATVDILDQLGKLDTGQMEVNKVEAAHEGSFVAGWRPFIGWTCGMAIAYEYVFAPIVIYTALLFGYHMPPPPTISGDLWQLITGMLGMGALRSFEKVRGISAGLTKG